MTAVRRALPLWLVLMAAYASTLAIDAAPGHRLSAAEAHRLLDVRSVVSDGDVDLRNQYAQRAWRALTTVPLVPGVRPQPGSGRIVEAQGLGFTLLLAPAYAVAGATGARLLLAALTALAFCLAAALARRLVPEPWASRAALVCGLSPPVLAAATAVSPELAGAAVLAGAALLALHVREQPRAGWAFWCAALVAALPWLAAKLVLPGAVVAIALARWLRRRQRGLAGFIALEVALTSGVVYLTVCDRLFGGLTPHSAAAGGATAASSVGDYLARWPRLAGVWIDRDTGLVVAAPVVLLALVAVGLLVRSRRERLAAAIGDQVDVEVTAAFLVVVVAAVVATAVVLAPPGDGTAFAGRQLLPAMPLLAALSAWGLRAVPRAGTALVVLTVAGSVWLLAAGLTSDRAGLRPASGPLPWGAAQATLPRVR